MKHLCEMWVQGNYFLSFRTNKIQFREVISLPSLSFTASIPVYMEFSSARDRNIEETTRLTVEQLGRSRRDFLGLHNTISHTRNRWLSPMGKTQLSHRRHFYIVIGSLHREMRATTRNFRRSSFPMLIGDSCTIGDARSRREGGSN